MRHARHSPPATGSGRNDETGEFPTEVFKTAWELGLTSVEVPEAYGVSGRMLTRRAFSPDPKVARLGFTTGAIGQMASTIAAAIASRARPISSVSKRPSSPLHSTR